jgi:hypothetical protein
LLDPIDPVTGNRRVSYGDSGAPLLLQGPEGWQAVALMSFKVDAEGHDSAINLTFGAYQEWIRNALTKS